MVELFILLFADDIILLSNTIIGLQIRWTSWLKSHLTFKSSLYLEPYFTTVANKYIRDIMIMIHDIGWTLP